MPDRSPPPRPDPSRRHDDALADLLARLAEDADLRIEADQLEELSEALAQLLALAASLRELPLDGVEPVFGYPRWE